MIGDDQTRLYMWYLDTYCRVDTDKEQDRDKAIQQLVKYFFR